MPNSIKSSWQRIETWLRENALDMLEMLHPPATDAEIAALESTLGLNLPSDLKESLAIHRGADDNAMIFPCSDSWGGKAFSPMPFEEIFQDWKMWKELIEGGEFDDTKSQPADGIRNDWWHVNWIPFAYNTAGDYQCVDLAPTNAGIVGQVIGAWHDDDERQLIAPSLRHYLENIADGLESGALVNDKDDGIVRKVDDE